MQRLKRPNWLSRVRSTPAGDPIRLGGSRWISIYEPHAAFSLLDELQHLSRRAIEPNAFFDPRFLIPAMPRLEDKSVRLLVARDEAEGRSRLRFFMPFSVEVTAPLSRRKAVRAWTHPFGRLGVLPLDTDDPAATAASLFEALQKGVSDLPPVLVLPDLPLDGPLTGVLARTAIERGLAVGWADRTHRACLDARSGDAGGVLRAHLGGHGFRDHRRRLRLLEGAGRLQFEVARHEGDLRNGFEDFLYLEAAGWKGRAGSALLQDRHRAAFAREAMSSLSAQRDARIYALRLDGEVIASLVVLLSNGSGVAWKTAYDERFARARPGALVAALATEAMVEDSAIRFVDSCAMPDHAIFNALWPGRLELGTMVVALRAEANADVPLIVGDIDRRRRALEARWKRRLRLRALMRRFSRG